MLEVKNNTISLTRGDDTDIELVLYTPAGDVYNLQEGEKVVFTVRKSPAGISLTPPLFSKEFVDRVISIASIDTKFLEYGEYLWDCQLIYGEGKINTICQGEFILTYEVTQGG